MKQQKSASYGVDYPSAPFAFLPLGLAFGIGMFCLLLDTHAVDADAFSAVSWVYLRKEITPPIWWKIFFILLGIGGVITHIRFLISLFTHNSPLKRKISDIIAIALFVANSIFNIGWLLPLERMVGSFALPGIRNPNHDLFEELFNTLFNYHEISLFLLFGMICNNFWGWSIHTEVMQKVQEKAKKEH
eukprot:TRINITY_DN9409_c0_g1_i2.p1 TRINITY_DN9409_c0_g1~~TRINITY_DN9409_c0_g1_i2.p1  ORF type:complete len:188 (-),score=29.66 TRINITY_DN9409_c0_g1_i2:59-622(-)